MRYLLFILLFTGCSSFYDLHINYGEVTVHRDYMCDPEKYLVTFPTEPRKKNLDFIKNSGIAEIVALDHRHFVLTVPDPNLESQVKKFIKQMQ